MIQALGGPLCIPQSGLVFTVLLVIGLVTGCKREVASADPDGRGGGGVDESPRVTTSLVTVRPMERGVTVLGSLQAMDRAVVSIQVGGRLNSLEVDVGRKVMAGEVMAQVEQREYELRLQQALAQLGQARARLGLDLDGEDDTVDPDETSLVRETRARFEEARKNVERNRALRVEGLVADSELEGAEAGYEVAVTRLAEAMQEVRERQAILSQRRAEYQIAKQRLIEASLRAPFDGVVQARLANVGEFLSPGSPVVELVRIHPLRLQLDIPERSAQLIRADQVVRMTLENDPEEYTGTLARLSPALDPRTRMLRVEAEFPNPGHLRPGAFVRAVIVVAPDSPTLAMPADALVTFAGTEKAFLVVTNHLSERRIVTGRAQGEWIEVLEGLSEGDRVVRNPRGLRAGMMIHSGAGEISQNVSPTGAPVGTVR